MPEPQPAHRLKPALRGLPLRLVHVSTRRVLATVPWDPERRIEEFKSMNARAFFDTIE